MLISVIMNCFNGEFFLKQSIDSVLSSNYNNFELIFFDNCSTDNSIKIAESFNDKRIKIFENFAKEQKKTFDLIGNVQNTFRAIFETFEKYLKNDV